jgi:hypothetical protein
MATMATIQPRRLGAGCATAAAGPAVRTYAGSGAGWNDEGRGGRAVRGGCARWNSGVGRLSVVVGIGGGLRLRLRRAARLLRRSVFGTAVAGGGEALVVRWHRASLSRSGGAERAPAFLTSDIPIIEGN